MIKQMIPLFLLAAMCSGFVPGNFNKQPTPDSTKKAKKKPVKSGSRSAKSLTAGPADLLMLPLFNQPGIK
jgi:hypothetical protein